VIISLISHGSIAHVVVNGVMLLIFVPSVCRTLGIAGLFLTICLSAIFGNAAQVIADMIADIHAPVVGSSSIAFGLMAALALGAPHRKTLRLTAIVCAMASLILAVSVPTSQTAHASHLGGMVGGVFAASLLQRFVLNPDR